MIFLFSIRLLCENRGNQFVRSSESKKRKQSFCGKVAANVGLTPKTVWLTRQRYQQGGLERALYERARPGKAALLDARQRQRLIALVCSPPPQGRARWTVRLLAEEAVKRKLVPRVGRETVRVLLESHDLKPWREKNVVRGPVG